MEHVALVCHHLESKNAAAIPCSDSARIWKRLCFKARASVSIIALRKGSEMNLDSNEFINLLVARDPDAGRKVVQTYTRQLFHAALGIGFDSVSSEELVQRVWATFFEVLPKFERRSKLRTFIFGILYNKALELRREVNKFEVFDAIDEYMEKRFNEDGSWAKPPINPEEFAEATESLELVEKCLEKLPVAQRMAFQLKEIDDQDSEEICKILAVSVTNLGVILFRARNRLRECIEDRVKAKKAKDKSK